MSNKRTKKTKDEQDCPIKRYRVSLPGRLFAVEFCVNTDYEPQLKSWVNDHGIPAETLILSNGDYCDIACRKIALKVYEAYQLMPDIKIFKTFILRMFGFPLDGRMGIELVEIDFPGIMAADFMVDKEEDIDAIRMMNEIEQISQK